MKRQDIPYATYTMVPTFKQGNVIFTLDIPSECTLPAFYCFNKLLKYLGYTLETCSYSEYAAALHSGEDLLTTLKTIDGEEKMTIVQYNKLSKIITVYDVTVKWEPQVKC
jgi:hypothetical protein